MLRVDSGVEQRQLFDTWRGAGASSTCDSACSLGADDDNFDDGDGLADAEAVRNASPAKRICFSFSPSAAAPPTALDAFRSMCMSHKKAASDNAAAAAAAGKVKTTPATEARIRKQQQRQRELLTQPAVKFDLPMPQDPAYAEIAHVIETMDPDQQMVVAAMGKQNVVVIGGPGTGKSRTVMSFCKNTIVTCLTSSVIVSLKQEWVKIHGSLEQLKSRNCKISHAHSLFDIEISCKTVEQWKAKHRSWRKHERLEKLVEMIKRANKAKVKMTIVIDEMFASGGTFLQLLGGIVSQLCVWAWESQMLERKNAGKPGKPPAYLKRPFGDMCVIGVGDPLQIASLVDDPKNPGGKQIPENLPETEIFKSLWPDIEKNVIYLTKVYRQSGNELLQKIADTIATEPLEVVLPLLRQLPVVRMEDLTPEHGPIIAHRVNKVQELNDTMLKKNPDALHGPFLPKLYIERFSLKQLHDGNFGDLPLDNGQDIQEVSSGHVALWAVATSGSKIREEATRSVLLKCGAPVIITANLDADKSWVNGTMCVVIDFTSKGYPVVMREAEYTQRTAAAAASGEDFIYDVEKDGELGHTLVVEPHSVPHVVPINLNSGRAVPGGGSGKPVYATFRVEYMPLILGYSLTTRRVQGMSLECAALVPGKEYSTGLHIVQFTRARKQAYVVDGFPPDFTIRRDPASVKFLHRCKEISLERRRRCA